ncbi:MAG: DUF3052 domain-containing protein [Gemmatimonadaceae bacterium]
MPSTAGYSGTPLARKLGVNDETTIVSINAPKNYLSLLEPLPPGARISMRASKHPAFVHVFATTRAELAKHLKSLRAALTQNGVVWVSWPKKSAKVPTEITEDTIRAVALPLGFVDVKVCAVDETWSGLKLVIRRELRTR